MGSLLSTQNVTGQYSEDREGNELTRERNGVEAAGGGHTDINSFRFIELMHALQKITRIQQEATSARIDARQKRREAALKRQEVWVWDAKFMVEVQRLSAEGRLAGFEELTRLAARCQATRDGLGPIEQEGSEAEQHWEGRMWQLRQTEEQLCRNFEREFLVAGSVPPPSASDESSQFESSLQDEVEDIDEQTERGIVPIRTSASVASGSSNRPWHGHFSALDVKDGPGSDASMYQDLNGIQVQRNASQAYSGGSDSGFGYLDDIDDTDALGRPQGLPQYNAGSIEQYPNLLRDFRSRRDRINRWLKHMMLNSHPEATSQFEILTTRLAADNRAVPSNWSQLVIAYWELDGEASPHSPPLSHVNLEGGKAEDA